MSSEVLTIIDKDGKAAKGKDPEPVGLTQLKKPLPDDGHDAGSWTTRGFTLQRQGRIGFYLQSDRPGGQPRRRRPSRSLDSPTGCSRRTASPASCCCAAPISTT